MKPAPFTYHRPADLDTLVATMAELGDDAKVLAGGQSLVPLLALRLASPPHLVDIGRVLALQSVEVRRPAGSAATGHLVIGANVTQRSIELDPDLVERVPLLADALPLIAHPQIRNRGTVCGSIAHADPAAELPAVALALDARIVVRSARGTRTIDASDFFVSYLDTALEPDEVVLAVEFPLATPRSGAAFREISRRHGDFAMAGVAASLTLDHNGRISDARLALSGVASIPLRAGAAEAALIGAAPGDETFLAAASEATVLLDPPDDIHATAAYRKHIAGVLVRRALRAAHLRAAARLELL
jgi:carbon-monoxide dehydrogenase medium subunit